MSDFEDRGLNRYRATVVDHYDGDSPTLCVDVGFHMTTEQRFRLLGCNTPETRGPERALGRLAQQVVRSLMPVGSRVHIHTYKEGKYGRWLVSVELADGRDLAETLVTDGYALPYDGRGAMPRFDPSKPYPLEGA